MGIGEPLLLPREIEIEYESKGRARKRGIKGTRIRKMRRKKADFKKRKRGAREVELEVTKGKRIIRDEKRWIHYGSKKA